MPKSKTRSSAKKRYTVTGTGKIMHQRTKLRHKLEHKSSRQTRRLAGKVESAKADTPRIRKMLGR